MFDYTNETCQAKDTILNLSNDFPLKASVEFFN